MEPEEKARQNIDKLLESAGWKVQDYDQMNLGAAFGAGRARGESGREGACAGQEVIPTDGDRVT